MPRATRANLASSTGQAGDPAGARDQYAALLPDIERALGARHPETPTTRHNLASWTGFAGDPAGARDLFAALLVIGRTLGAGHEFTLSTHAGLVYWAQKAASAG